MPPMASIICRLTLQIYDIFLKLLQRRAKFVCFVPVFLSDCKRLACFIRFVGNFLPLSTLERGLGGEVKKNIDPPCGGPIFSLVLLCGEFAGL